VSILEEGQWRLEAIVGVIGVLDLNVVHQISHLPDLRLHAQEVQVLGQRVFIVLLMLVPESPARNSGVDALHGGVVVVIGLLVEAQIDLTVHVHEG
jgi:hypothetical protein